ncbi:MAG: phosphoribosylglycinamide formyltransferase [Gemmatimonadetes bacterium]|nr:phosphoribosylglycinamide formyltransferase [Gemmatimonadota bacterium]
MSRARIAVLASGSGSNLQAILDYLSSLGERRGGDVVLVASDRPDAGALARARAAGTGAEVLTSARYAGGHDLARLLDDRAIDLLVLAGFLQLVPADVVRAYHGRVLNVHPAPLPIFGGPGMYGARVHRAVLKSDVRFSGPTVHFVDEEYDHGAIIAHWPVPVLSGDDEHALAARVLRAEHVLFPRVVDAVAANEVLLGSQGNVAPPFFRMQIANFDPGLDDATLGTIIDRAR